MDNLNFDIDPQLKKEVEAILLQNGIKPVDAVRSLYEAIQKQKGMPVFTNSEEMDETEYILSTPGMAEKLKKGMEDFREGKNLVDVEWSDELDRFVEKKNKC